MRKLFAGLMAVILMGSAFSYVSLSLAAAATVATAEYGTTESIRDLETASRLRELALLIDYYDEVLTQSARNYAFTRDKKWESRYRESEPKLIATLEEALEKGDRIDKEFLERIDKANLKLVEMEYRSIELVNAGQTQQAVDILESSQYWQQKKIYSQSLKAYVQRRGEALSGALLSIRRDYPVIQFTDEEKKWLKAHPVIRVVSEPDYVPFDFRIDGEPAGYSIDYVQILADRLGVRLEFVKDTWGNLLKRAENKEVDLVHSIFKAPKEREEYLNFTRPYKEVINAIVVRDDRTGINSLQDLAQKKVALAKGDSLVKTLKKVIPDAQYVYFDNYTEVLKTVALGKVDAAVTELPVAAYLIRSLSLTNLKFVAEAGNIGGRDQRYRLAVRKDWPMLVSILEKGMDTLSSDEIKRLDDKWMPLAEVAKKKKTLELIDHEKAWLKAHPAIRMGFMNAWPPMNFVDERGIPQGIGVDYIEVLNQYLGGIIVLEPRPFKESYDLVKNKKLDALMDITPIKEREPFFNFTKPYLTIPHVIVGRKDGPYFNSEKDLAGKTIALERGFYNVKFFQKNYPEVTVKEYDSTSDALDAVSRGRVDAYAGNRAVVMYLIERELLANLMIQGRQQKPPVVLSIGVRKDWPVLAGLLDRALASISPEEVRQINVKWFKEVQDVIAAVQLTPEERAWLEAHPLIRVAADTRWAPVEFVDEDEEFKGISIDYLKQLSEILGVEFQFEKDVTWQQAMDAVESGEMDMFSSVARTPKREARYNFTTPYLSMPINIFAGGDVTYIGNLKALKGKRVAVVEGYAIHEWLRDNQPEIKLVTAKSIPAALKMLAADEVYAFVGNVVTTSYYISELRLSQIKVAGETLYAYDQAMAVRQDWPILAGILQKALDSISQNERDSIFNRWVSVKYEHGFDYSLLWKALVPAFIIVMLFFYWNRRLSKEVTERKLAEVAMRQSRAQVQAIIDNMQAAVFMKDLDCRHLLVNKYYEEAAGVKNEDALGKTDFEIFPKEVADQIVSVDRKVMSSGEMQTFEEKVPHPDGTVRHYLTTKVPLFNDEGNVYGMCGLATDITERKRMEEALRESRATERGLLDATQESLLLLDSEGIIIAVNQTAARRHQRTPEDLIGTNRFDILPQNLRESRKAHFNNVLQTGNPADFEDVRDGMVFHHIYYPVQDKTGAIIGVAIFAQEITERKHMEEELRRNVEELEQFSKLATGREIKMIQLKKEINEYLNKQGLESKYEIVE